MSLASVQVITVQFVMPELGDYLRCVMRLPNESVRERHMRKIANRGRKGKLIVRQSEQVSINSCASELNARGWVISKCTRQWREDEWRGGYWSIKFIFRPAGIARLHRSVVFNPEEIAMAFLRLTIEMAWGVRIYESPYVHADNTVDASERALTIRFEAEAVVTTQNHALTVTDDGVSIVSAVAPTALVA